MLGGIAQSISAFFTEAWDGIKSVWETVTGFFADIWSAITGDEGLTGITEKISGFFTGAWETIEKVWLDKAVQYGVSLNQLHIDPCVMALATMPSAMEDFAYCIQQTNTIISNS